MTLNKNKSFICPFCFEEHQIKDVHFRCRNPRCKVVEGDLELTKYEHGDISKPRTEKKWFKVSTDNKYNDRFFEVCPECGERSYKVLCPSCHNVLPESSLTGNAMIFSVIGARDTGKTNYIGVLIHEFMERIAPAFGGSLIGFDDSLKRYKETYGDPLYKDLRRAELSKSVITANASSGAYRPLIFTLTLPKKAIFGKKIDTFTFVFYDTAGEDLQDFDTMSTVAKYISKSKGIIFLLDPLKIENVSIQLNEEDVALASSVSEDQVTPSEVIMQMASDLIRNAGNIPSSRQIETPVGVVFSKFDVIEQIIPKDGLAIRNTSPHCDEHAFIATDAQNVNNEIQALLDAWGYTALIKNLNTNYKTYSFFTASAFGLHNNADENGKIHRPNPHRVEDAFLWLFAQNNCIPKRIK